MKTFLPLSITQIRTALRILLVLAFILGCSQRIFAQVVVIAHKSSPVATLDNDKLLDIFTLNTKNWSDGGKITLLEIKGDSPAKAKFYAALGTSFGEMQKLWLKKQFAGKGLPPTALASEDEIIQRVANTPGAIGYISADKAPKDVKIIAKF
ncbi:MAG: substrate-binding domain-containing protein [Candidatus Kapabacteria bacterium]|jgi:ABC-type phosphate transport system substrate-binding protein|nr:substrate-binding domain-containing protein [Candidatus Kapabacteria bacterium]